MPSILRWGLVAIKEVGFPIVCCCFLFYIVIINNAKLTEALEKMTTALQENRNALIVLKSSVDDHMRDARPVIDEYKRVLQGQQKSWSENERRK